MIQSIRNVGERELFGVFHSFGGTVAELEAILELGNFLISINGVVTFKKSGLPETLKGCGVEKSSGNRFTLPAPTPYRANATNPHI